MTTQRNNAVSIAKGIGIMLMVLAHSQFSEFGDDLINMFHMPLFFIMSGYCFKESYLSDAKKYVMQKIKGIYWPYVKWSAIFLALHNICCTLHLYDPQFGYTGMTCRFDAHDFMLHAVKIVGTMSGHDLLLGGFWFLKSLFVGSLLFYGAKRLLKHDTATCAALLAICMALCMVKASVTALEGVAKMFQAAFFIGFGHAYRNRQPGWEKKWWICPAAAILATVGALFFPTRMLTIGAATLLPFTLCAIAGTLAVFGIGQRMAEHDNAATRLLQTLGERTMRVFVWHLPCFKLVSLAIIAIYGLPIERLAEFPAIEQYATAGWWLAYTVAGCMPGAFGRRA